MRETRLTRPCACEDLRRTAADWTNNELTPAELADRLVEIRENAQLSESTKIRDLSDDLVTAPPDYRELGSVFTWFGQACIDLDKLDM
jgi:hypothetical protein